MPQEGHLRIVTLDDDMDLAAPKGSAPWARAVRVHMVTMLQDATTQLQRFRRHVQLFEKERGYQQLDDVYGHPFPSMRAFCTAKAPHGLGYDPALLEAMVQETREITLGEKIAEIQKLREHGAPEGNHNAAKNKPDNTKVDTSTFVEKPGRASAYQVARLKRDRPDIAEALARGEYPSVRAAAKAAGIVADPTPLDYLHRYWRKVDPDARLRFLVEMLTPNERRALTLGFDEDPAP